MSDNKRRRPRSKKGYVHRPNALCVTVHSIDGSPVPRSVLAEAAAAVEEVATRYGLLINLAET